MWTNLKAFWDDERGFIISIELILIATIGVLGLIVGLSCLSSAIVAEYQDLGWAVRSLNQSYFFGGFRGCKSWVPGSSFVNRAYYNGSPVAMENWDLGMGTYGAPGYAAPTYVAPAYVAPATVIPGPALLPQDCPPLIPPTTVVPCPSGDCQTEKVIPGAPLTPQPEQSLPRSNSVEPIPRQEAPAPALPPLQ
ncbi:MAG: hypothetical protein V4719_13905 [Planctomycetota bacterium]